MNFDKQDIRVNELLHHLELDIDGIIAFIEYKLTHNKLFLVHTEVPHELEGKGVGTAIIQKAFEFAKANNYWVVPICPFVKHFLEKQKEWNAIVAPDAERFIHNH